MVKEHILPDSMIFTDEFAAYDGIKHMPKMGYKHRRIKHSAKGLCSRQRAYEHD